MLSCLYDLEYAYYKLCFRYVYACVCVSGGGGGGGHVPLIVHSMTLVYLGMTKVLDIIIVMQYLNFFTITGLSIPPS